MDDRSVRVAPLVAWLNRVAASDDRGTLATLRGSLREGRSIEALRYVLPFLARGADRRQEDDACLLAGLFALHPHGGSRTLASSLRIVWKAGSDSTEERFLALLSADRADLSAHLRHAVSLVAGNDLALDWNDLYRAIRWWGDERDFVPRRWAADFWASDPRDADEAGEDGLDVSESGGPKEP